VGKGSISFLKKRNKKLLNAIACANGQKFFGSFFQKRTAFGAVRSFGARVTLRGLRHESKP
jgi:hypothetical protein